jgi:hypothetical protein
MEDNAASAFGQLQASCAREADSSHLAELLLFQFGDLRLQCATENELIAAIRNLSFDDWEDIRDRSVDIKAAIELPGYGQLHAGRLGPLDLPTLGSIDVVTEEAERKEHFKLQPSWHMPFGWYPLRWFRYQLDGTQVHIIAECRVLSSQFELTFYLQLVLVNWYVLRCAYVQATEARREQGQNSSQASRILELSAKIARPRAHVTV